MSLFGDWMKSKNMSDPVRGTAQVIGASMPPDHATSANATMTLVVTADGVPATPIKHHAMCPTRKWPMPGSTLPVTVDRADPDRLKIMWDEIPESGEVNWQNAQAIAEAMQGSGAQPMDPSQMAGFGGAQNITIDASGGDIDPAQRAQLQAMGIDVDALLQQARAVQEQMGGGMQMPGQAMPGMPGQGMPGLPGQAMPGAGMPGMPGAGMPGQAPSGAPDSPDPQPMAGQGLPGQPMPMPGRQDSGDDLTDQLARLAELHQSGALSAEEFAAAKKRLLEGS